MTDENHDQGHDRSVCGGKTKSGGDCQRPAGWGTNHSGVGKCKLHGGATPNHVKHAGREMAERELYRLGRPLEGADPQEQLLLMVGEAAANVATLRSLVANLEDLVVVETGPGGSHREAVSAYATLYQTWTDRLVSYSASAIKCGLAERAVRVSEQQGQLLAKVVMAFLDDPEFGLSREQRDIGRRIAGRHLRALAAAQTDAP